MLGLGLLGFRHSHIIDLGVSKNNDIPKSSILNRVFHYKPSILGYPLFLETPICTIYRFVFLKSTPDWKVLGCRRIIGSRATIITGLFPLLNWGLFSVVRM